MTTEFYGLSKQVIFDNRWNKHEFIKSVPGQLQNWCVFPIFLLTHWGRDKMAAILQTMDSNTFSWMKMYEFCSLKFVPKVRITNIPALVQIMALPQQGDKPLSEPMMVRLPMHIYVTRPQWVTQFHCFWNLLFMVPSTNIEKDKFAYVGRSRTMDTSLHLSTTSLILPVSRQLSTPPTNNHMRDHDL